MLYPPSLPDDVLARAFRAPNGELGILPADADLFLAACETDQVEVLGWDLWLVDHRELPNGKPSRSVGNWCGLIPTLDNFVPAVVGGSADSKASRTEIAALKLGELVDQRWRPYLRYNFTLDE